MSTNYYAKHPGMKGEGLHIGKSSGGWEFLWRAHPDMELTSTEAWRKFLDHPWVAIEAEYGVTVTAGEFWQDVITIAATNQDPLKAKWDAELPDHDYWAQRQWRDEAGFPFADYEFC